MSKRLYCEGCAEVVRPSAVEECLGEQRHRTYCLVTMQKRMCGRIRPTTAADEAVLKQCAWWDTFMPMRQWGYSR